VEGGRVIPDAGWAGFLNGAVKSHVFQTPGWGALKSRMGWRVHRVAVERDGVFRAGWQILERGIPYSGRCFFYAPRGPVVGPECGEADAASLFRQTEALARERRAMFVKVDPDFPAPGSGRPGDAPADGDMWSRALTGHAFRPAPAAGGFSGVQPRVVFRLDISGSEEALLAAMEQKTRYNIRLAEKRGVTVRPVADAADIETFYGILTETARRDGFLIRPARYFRDIQECLGPAAQYFLAEKDGAPIAGALALTCGTTAWYAYGASANTAREHMPNHFLQWTLIRWAKSRGCRLYDFRAVPSDPSPTDPLYGLYRFKKGFGGTLTTFVGEYDRVYASGLYLLWTRAWPLFKNLRRRVLLRTR
jgi:lipid II:glycine glycyltransferase (peptidoglycan interpeptide bridge formation enzyme)